MDTLDDLMFGIMNNDYGKADKCGRDKVNGYTIDTCYTIDQGYETAMWKDLDEIVIVERYPDKARAETGHKKWCEFAKTNPKSVYSVQIDEDVYF
mgnify:CR=1 FL=1